METTDLLDEIAVVDSDSTDDTYAVATDAGAVVHRSAEIRPDLGSVAGKGEAMWKSLFVTKGDLLVFMDADLLDWDTDFVPGLLGPLLTRPEIALVKGYYERPLVNGDGQGAHSAAYEGGRVTELVARPLLDLALPRAVRAGSTARREWAVRRSLFASLSVPTGYAVEMSALLDTAGMLGVDAIALFYLGVARTGIRRCATWGQWQLRSSPPRWIGRVSTDPTSLLLSTCGSTSWLTGSSRL